MMIKILYLNIISLANLFIERLNKDKLSEFATIFIGKSQKEQKIKTMTSVFDIMMWFTPIR